MGGDCRGSRPGLAAPMGKHTYHRSPGTPIRTRTTVTLPVFGGVVFLVGSVFFWPGLEEWAGYLGASLFVFGSACYLVSPIIDWYELTYTQKLPEPTDPPGSVGHYEWLYASQMLHTQRSNAILYAVGSVCFVAGSVLFFPALRAQSTHGAWLYLTGCVCIFLGALLAAFTAVELRKTAEPHYFEKKWWLLWWCSDESAQVISCMLYMLGNANFAAGSICIFPKMHFLGGLVIEDEHLSDQAATVLFVIGSAVLVMGAAIDYVVFVRQPYRHASKPTEKSSLVLGQATL